MAAEHLTKAANYAVTAREIDFVTRFQKNWEALRTILGIMRPIKKTPGAVLKSKKAFVTLQSGDVGEGEEIPYSEANVKEYDYLEMGIEKYSKAVSIEAIKEHGYDVAVGMTDDEFRFELQSLVMSRFYTYLNTGALTSVQKTYQMALAMAKGYVVNKFKEMHRTATKIVAFANVLDVYEYIGTANVTVQTAFGFDYIKNFMGLDTVFLLSNNEIARGTVIATPIENINLYYVSPSDSDFARADFRYTTQGETPLIGYHSEVDYSKAVTVSYALMGMVMFSEYLDGIAVVKLSTDGSIGTLTVTSEAGTDAGATKITVSGEVEDNGKLYYYKSGTVSAAYLDDIDSSWTAWDGASDIAGLAANSKITVAETNGAGQILATGTATVTVNE